MNHLLLVLGTLLVGILIGAVGGILVYRKNAAKIKAVEDAIKK